jgi:hypothetical protein
MDRDCLNRTVRTRIVAQARAVAMDCFVAATRHGTYHLDVPRVHILAADSDACCLANGVIMWLRRHGGFRVLHVDPEAGFTVNWAEADLAADPAPWATHCRAAADTANTVPSLQVQTERAIAAGTMTNVRMQVPTGVEPSEAEAQLKAAGLPYTVTANGAFIVDLTALVTTDLVDAEDDN